MAYVWRLRRGCGDGLVVESATVWKIDGQLICRWVREIELTHQSSRERYFWRARTAFRNSCCRAIRQPWPMHPSPRRHGCSTYQNWGKLSPASVVLSSSSLSLSLSLPTLVMEVVLRPNRDGLAFFSLTRSFPLLRRT